MIKINDFTFSYSSENGPSKKIFSNLNFSIEANEWVGVLAPYGVGKSALLKTIANLYEHEGQLEFNGSEKIKTIYIPSQPTSFQWLSVKENLRLAKKFTTAFTDERLQNVIAQVGLEGYEDHFPQSMSKGFRFRISLARAILLQPDLLALDEILSEMNSQTKSEIIGLLQKIKTENFFSVLYGSSNVSEVISICDRIILLGSSPAHILGEMKLSGDFQIDQENVLEMIRKSFPDEKGILI